MLNKLKTFESKDCEAAYEMAKELERVFHQAAKGETSYREISPLLESAFKMQFSDGLIRLTDDKEIPPSDIRVDLWYKPTYTVACLVMHFVLTGDMPMQKNSAWEDNFHRLLSASAGRNFMGHGIDDLTGMCSTIGLFCEAGLPEFMEQFADFCPKFTELVNTTEQNLARSLQEGKTTDAWGRNLENDYRMALSGLHGKTKELFVYGTLMRGRANHSCMVDADFSTEGLLTDFAMYDLGAFPGIQPSKGDFVKGEFYFVNGATLEALNRLEGEGTLYRLVPVIIESRKKPVYVYEYLGKTVEKKKVDLIHQPWGKKQDGYVWYACYGSNLLEERFLCYLQGGQCPYNGKIYKGCKDETPPKAVKPVTIPFEMYYGNHSASWNNSGVSFLDSIQRGQTPGRMYLITEEQFYEIHKQEGSGDNWYNQLIYLGKDTGFDIYTFTNKIRREECRPDKSYVEVLRRGLIETYPKITEKELKRSFPEKESVKKR